MKLLRLFAFAASVSLSVIPGLGASAAGLLLASGKAHAQSNNSASFTPVVQTSAYASGNAIGALQTVSFLQPSQTGIFDNFTITSKGGSTTAMTVYIFDTNPTASTCNGATAGNAFVLAAADVPKLAMVPFVLTPALIGAGATATFAQLTQTVSIRNQDVPIKNALYVCLVANGAVTPATASDLVGKISVATDGG